MRCLLERLSAPRAQKQHDAKSSVTMGDIRGISITHGVCLYAMSLYPGLSPISPVNVVPAWCNMHLLHVCERDGDMPS